MEKIVDKKKVVIIGGGISGLTAGIYALDNGFDVTIYEKHNIVGGQCTGWTRKGAFIDGCAHWIVGTNPNSPFNPLWRHIGAINDSTNIHETEFFSKFVIGEETVTIYADLEKLRQEFLRVAPEDKRKINEFIRVAKAYRHVQIPLKKPLDKMDIFSLTKMGLKMLPMVPFYNHYRKVQTVDYGKKFKSPILQDTFRRIMTPNYNVHSLFYILQALSLKDAGMIESGSKNVASRIQDRFEELGGKVVVNANVKKIIIKDNVATGILLEGDKEINADYVICSTDIHHTLTSLLENKYIDTFFEEKFNHIKQNPLQICCLTSHKVKKNIDNYPKMIDIPCEPFYIGSNKIDHLGFRNHSFDKTLNKNSTTVCCLLCLEDDGIYDELKKMSKEEYLEYKNKLGLHVQEYIKKYFELSDEEVELIDVATPLTYERYTNAYRGSYMSFITTSKTKGLMTKGLVKGVKNLVLAGQWLMPPGGLPIALFTGKHAAYRVTKLNKQRFIDNDKKYKKEF